MAASYEAGGERGREEGKERKGMGGRERELKPLVRWTRVEALGISRGRLFAYSRCWLPSARRLIPCPRTTSHTFYPIVFGHNFALSRSGAQPAPSCRSTPTNDLGEPPTLDDGSDCRASTIFYLRIPQWKSRKPVAYKVRNGHSCHWL